jgi:large subunit ribosomal protein L30
MSSADRAVRSFFVTLRRGFVGTPWQQRRVLEALGLRKRMQTVEQPNNAATRGMLIKVCAMLRADALRGSTRTCP